MRILSQAGKHLVDVSNGGYLNIYDKAVWFVFYNSDFADLRLGDYTSEERAKEVVFEIAQHKESLYVMPEV